MPHYRLDDDEGSNFYLTCRTRCDGEMRKRLRNVLFTVLVQLAYTNTLGNEWLKLQIKFTFSIFLNRKLRDWNAPVVAAALWDQWSDERVLKPLMFVLQALTNEFSSLSRRHVCFYPRTHVTLRKTRSSSSRELEILNIAFWVIDPDYFRWQRNFLKLWLFWKYTCHAKLYSTPKWIRNVLFIVYNNK